VQGVEHGVVQVVRAGVAVVGEPVPPDPLVPPLVPPPSQHHTSTRLHAVKIIVQLELVLQIHAWFPPPDDEVVLLALLADRGDHLQGLVLRITILITGCPKKMRLGFCLRERSNIMRSS